MENTEQKLVPLWPFVPCFLFLLHNYRCWTCICMQELLCRNAECHERCLQCRHWACRTISVLHVIVDICWGFSSVDCRNKLQNVTCTNWLPTRVESLSLLQNQNDEPTFQHWVRESEQIMCWRLALWRTVTLYGNGVMAQNSEVRTGEQSKLRLHLHSLELGAFQ